MYAVYNEICDITITEKEKSKESIKQFIDFLKRLKSKFDLEGFICTNDIYINKPLLYLLQDWFDDPNVDREYKRFMRSFLGKYRIPLDTSNVDGDFILAINEKEYSSVGCTKACENNYPIVSRITDDFWKNREINGKYEYLFQEEIESKFSNITNLNPSWSDDELIRFMYDRKYENITSGYDLWERREELFPNLIFCDNVKNQLYEDPERYHIIKIMEKLKNLQIFFEKKRDSFHLEDLKMNARSESESVKNNSKLRSLRLFTKPDGNSEYFFYHISFSGKFSSGRIYFLPDISENKCYIGYIGRHLKTQKY